MESQPTGSAAFYNFLGWLDAKKKQLATAGVVVALLALVISFVVYRANAKETAASEALSEVQGAQIPTMTAPPGTGDAYLKVANAYAGTKAAARALVLAGACYFTDGKFAEAQTSFDRVLREYPASPWVVEAGMGIAASLDGAGKFDEAAQKYDDLIKRHGNDVITTDARVRLARIYELQNKPEQAHRLYEQLTSDAGPAGSTIAEEAREHLKELLRKHPNLVKTNTPTVVPAPAPVMISPPAATMTNAKPAAVVAPATAPTTPATPPAK